MIVYLINSNLAFNSVQLKIKVMRFMLFPGGIHSGVIKTASVKILQKAEMSSHYCVLLPGILLQVCMDLMTWEGKRQPIVSS